MAGSISLLIDSPLRDLALSLRAVDSDMRKQIGAATKSAAQPIWTEETRGRALSRIQQRALADSARVGVTARNVFLRSGGVGRLSSGTPVAAVARAAEHGVGAEKQVTQRSSKGKKYTRRIGPTFGPSTRRGNVVLPAAADSIPRFASLWAQTARRCLHEAIEKV